METRTSAAEAAAYLVWLAAHECEADPEYLTPLKLQKLLYYVQGWSFTEWERPFFHDQIQAWRNGPVVPTVYKIYKDRGIEDGHSIIPKDKSKPTGLSPDESALVRSVWDAYKKYSGYALADMTHQEVPYQETYTPDDAQKRCKRRIDNDLMKRAFVGRGKKAAGRLAGMRSRLRRFATSNTKKLVGRDVF